MDHKVFVEPKIFKSFDTYILFKSSSELLNQIKPSEIGYVSIFHFICHDLKLTYSTKNIVWNKRSQNLDKLRLS
jgi:hypothetical protein